MRNVFYHSLVNWKVIDELLLPFAEQEEAFQEAEILIIGSLDHMVMETIFYHLPEEEHEAFLELCQEKYEDEMLMEWLRERVDTIDEVLRGAIYETKLSLRQLLE